MISYIYDQGEIKSECCKEITKELRVCWTSQNVRVLAANIRGTQNTENVLQIFGNSTLELLTSRINHQNDRHSFRSQTHKAIATDPLLMKEKIEIYIKSFPFLSC